MFLARFSCREAGSMLCYQWAHCTRRLNCAKSWQLLRLQLTFWSFSADRVISFCTSQNLTETASPILGAFLCMVSSDPTSWFFLIYHAYIFHLHLRYTSLTLRWPLLEAELCLLLSPLFAPPSVQTCSIFVCLFACAWMPFFPSVSPLTGRGHCLFLWANFTPILNIL